MNTQTINISKALTLAFALAVGILVLLQVSRSAPADAAPTPPAQSPATSAPAARGTVLVTVLLKSNSLSSRLPKEATDLLTTTKGSSAARLAAQRNPYRRSESEAVAASIAENSRNAALPMIRRAAAPGIAASELVQRKIRRLGGRVISASPIPNQIVTRIPSSAIPVLKRDPRVAHIATARLPVSLAAPIDGSAVWWANGFTGQGGSADGNGSPDAVVFDTGIRTTHNVFKSRLPGDCGTCLGSGPSRVISPVIRSDFSGSKHANTIAAQIAGTAFTPSMNPAGQVGMAYGIDKLYDNYQATNPYLWDLGINVGSDTGLGGNTDLPEVINYSATIYQNTVDLDPLANYFDALESRYGILNTIGGGNCGIADPFYTNCSSGPHRVGTPGVNYNVLTMGGQDITANPADTSTYAPWPNSSPGPTWGGRKKPDLIGPVNGTAGTPSAIDDTTTTSFGYGTSFAAPVAAAGALLLASSGVYLPTAQKAIMINSARPVQGQTYWTPRTGWGAINMDTAYYARGNYVNANVSGTGPNSARFFQVTGVANGDRATLVWNRRTNIDDLPSPDNGQISNPGYYNLTNLDLTQFDPGTLAVTSTGGSDAGDTVDTDQTITAANPMPGNGSDGGDNVEQVRSTATGTQVLKVKALTSIDGSANEPFSVAANSPISALATPIPNVSVATSTNLAGIGDSVTVTATITNPSPDLPLTTPTATLDLPPGVNLTSGVNPRPLTTIAPSGNTVVAWTVQATSGGTKDFTVDVSGTAYGETFASSGTDDYTADATPPVLSLTPTPTYSQTASPNFTWSATDALTTIAGYDVDGAPGDSNWSSILSNSPSTSTALNGSEGQLLQLRVRARDSFGNTSDWSETSTTVDATPPVINLGPQQTPTKGQAAVSITYSNVGAPITSAVYSFSRVAAAPTIPVTSAPATVSNLGTTAFTATLTTTVTDALGRAVTRSQAYSVPPRYIAAQLSLAKTRVKKRVATISGRMTTAATGKVTITIKRSGKRGTKRVSKRVSIKNGRFSLKTRLKAGSYRATAAWAGSNDVPRASLTRKFRVK